MFTPEDASYNNYDVYPKSKSFKWLGNTDKFVFTEDNVIKFRNPGEKGSHELLSLDMLNGIAKDNGIGDFKRLPNITWNDENSGYFYKMNEGDIGDLHERHHPYSARQGRHRHVHRYCR